MPVKEILFCRGLLSSRYFKGSICLSVPMSNSSITVTVKLFAVYQEAYKVPELVLEFPQDTPVFAVRDRFITEHPSLAQWRDITRFGINLQFVAPDTVMQDGDEVVLIPPVSGG